MSQDTTPRNFDAEAAAWDEKPARVKLAGEIAAAIIAASGIGPDTSVLDFGCGTGLISLALAPLARVLTGADTSRGMLEVLAAKAAKAGITNVTGHHFDPDRGDLPEGPFDLVVSAMTLHHVPVPAEALARLFAVTAPGGLICLADLEPDGGFFHENNQGVFHFGFSGGQITQLLGRAGFAGVSARTAAHVTRGVPGGGTRDFGVFLATGRKPGA